MRIRKNKSFLLPDPAWLLILPLGVWAIAIGYVGTIGAFLSPVHTWLFALFIAALSILSLLGHVYAHRLFTQFSHASPPVRIFLMPWGDPAQSWPAATSPGREALDAVSGPIANLLLALVAFAIWNAQPAPLLNVSMPFIAIFNVWLAIVNLTPVFPLDGGRILHAIGWGWLKHPESAARLGMRAGYTLAAGLCAWGIFLITQNAQYSWETGGATILFGLLLTEGLKLHPRWTDNSFAAASGSSVREPLRLIPGLLSGLALLALTGISASMLLTNNGIQTPGVALPVGPMIQIPTQYYHPYTGSFILTSVVEQSPIPAGAWMLSKITPAVKFLPPEKYVPNALSPQQAAEEGYQELYQSETTALAVGMQLAGYPASVTGNGVKVVSIIPESHANGVLKPGDVIIGLNGKPVHLITDLTNPLQSMKAGELIHLLVKRDQQQKTFDIKLLPSASPNNPPIIGITIDSAGFTSTLPIPAKIVSQKIVGGPSAGLMFTLGVYNALIPQNLTGGRIIAGTGTINPDGTVGPIGGVQEKVVAAEIAGAKYFLSPPDNYADAVKAARSIKVVKIATVQEAITFLKSLPPE